MELPTEPVLCASCWGIPIDSSVGILTYPKGKLLLCVGRSRRLLFPKYLYIEEDRSSSRFHHCSVLFCTPLIELPRWELAFGFQGHLNYEAEQTETKLQHQNSAQTWWPCFVSQWPSQPTSLLKWVEATKGNPQIFTIDTVGTSELLQHKTCISLKVSGQVPVWRILESL